MTAYEIMSYPMAQELVFYTHPQSRGRMVRWMLEEVGQPYRTEVLDYATTMKAPAYRAINPMAKVPALKHGDTVITEVAAICTYLADAFPAAGLAPPPNSPLRGSYYRWLFFAAGPAEAAMSNKMLGFVVPEGRERMIGYGTYETAINTLETAVSKSDYLVDGKFSAADVYVGSQIGSAMQFGMIEKRPAFEAYWKRLGARPAYQRASEIDNAIVAQQKAAAGN